MIRRVGFAHIAPDVDTAARTALVDALRRVPEHAGDVRGLIAFDAAPSAPRSVGAGDIMILAAAQRRDDLAELRRHPYVLDVIDPLLHQCGAVVDEVVYEQGPVQLRAPALAHGVHRTLLLRVDPSASTEAVADFNRQLAGMGDYIDSIRNCSLSTPDPGNSGGWTHVWEQEYESVDGLLGPYMMHPYHWAVVDRWFDPESPTRIVDLRLIHAFCDLEQSLLAGGARAVSA